MDKLKFNIFLFISLFAKTLIEPFSLIFMYTSGFKVTEILLYFLLRYIFGLLILFIYPKISKDISEKYLMILSSLIFFISFYYLFTLSNNTFLLFIFALSQSLYSYIFTITKNRYILEYNNSKKLDSDIKRIISINQFACLPASLLGAFIIMNYNSIILLIITTILLLLSNIILFTINKDITVFELNKKDIIEVFKHNKIVLFLDQGKIILLSLLPLYIYIYIDSSLKYISIINIIIGIFSIFTMYFVTNHISSKVNMFAISSIFLALILILKINITSSIMLILLASFEGSLLKLHEYSMTRNIYLAGQAHDMNSFNIGLEMYYNFCRILLITVFITIPSLKFIIYICIIMIFLECFFNFSYKHKKL